MVAAKGAGFTIPWSVKEGPRPTHPSGVNVMRISALSLMALALLTACSGLHHLPT